MALQQTFQVANVTFQGGQIRATVKNKTGAAASCRVRLHFESPFRSTDFEQIQNVAANETGYHDFNPPANWRRPANVTVEITMQAPAQGQPFEPSDSTTTDVSVG